jgi:crotonobetainyl-CoA:carnitine CoA-transferase CaiB-like acyl-CoA transferase
VSTGVDAATEPGPLDGVTVLDLSEWVAGPFCAKVLGDHGARVVKIERPGGDPARRMGPFPDGRADPERSALFLHLNTNKQSVVIDPSTGEGAGLVRRLAARADVLIESFRPGTLAGWGLDPASLIAARPSLVVTSVTAFGQTGPYRDWEMTDLVAFAMGGPMNASGVADREPVKLAGNAVLMQSGSTAATATLAALYHAWQYGTGQHVDVATFETQNGSCDRRRYYLLSYAYSGVTSARVASVGVNQPVAGGRFACADGAVVSTGRVWPDHIERMVRVLDDPEVTAVWDAAGQACMHDHADVVDAGLARWAARRPARVAMREAQAGGWPVVVSNDPMTLLDDEHLQARGFWVTAAHPDAGTLPHPGPPFRLPGDGWSLRRTAPRLGADTDAVLRDLAGCDEEGLASLRVRGVVA